MAKAIYQLTSNFATVPISQSEVDILVSGYANAMMRGSGASESITRKDNDTIYTLDGASWTPAGIASNPYLNELVVRNVLNKLTKEGASQEKIETTLEQYSVASAWLASNSIDTQAAIIAGATNLSATAIVAIITKNRGGKALTHSEISAIQRIAQNKKTTVNTNKDTVKNIPNLTKEGTLKNLAPNLSVTLNTSVRTLIKDSEGRYWLVNNSGARITPSGNYAY